MTAPAASRPTLADVVKQYEATDFLPGVPIDVQALRLNIALSDAQNIDNPTPKDRANESRALGLLRNLHKSRADQARDTLRAMWLAALVSPRMSLREVTHLVEKTMEQTDSVWLAKRREEARKADEAAGKPAEQPESKGDEQMAEGGAA